MGKNTFRNYEKILRRKEYLTVYKKGIRSYSESFTIIVHKHDTGSRRMGITVSKKVGNAVRRNRIKRLLREFFRLHKQRLSESQDIVIVGKKGLPRLTYEQVCAELENLLVKR